MAQSINANPGIRNLSNRQVNKGSALLSAISIAAVVLLFVLTVATIQKTSQKKTIYMLGSERARYLAEAGIYSAIARLKNNAPESLLPLELEEEIDGYGSYRANIVSRTDGWEVVSEGTVSRPDGLKKEIRAQLKFKLPDIFDFGLYIENYFAVSTRKTFLNGRAASRGAIDLVGPATDKDYELFPESDVIFPEINFYPYDNRIEYYDELLARPAHSDKVYESRQTFHRVHPPDFSRYRIIYVKGDITIEGGSGIAPLVINGPGTLIAEGKMNISERVILSRDITLISAGKLTAEDKTEFTDAVLYSPSGVELRDNAAISGEVYSRKGIKMTGSARSSETIFYLKGIVDSGELTGNITVTGNAVAGGTILCVYDRGASFVKNNLTVEIYPEAVVNGVIFSENMLKLKGTVNGSAAAKYLSGGLWDAGIINRVGLPNRYLLPEVIRENFNKEIELVYGERS